LTDITTVTAGHTDHAPSEDITINVPSEDTTVTPGTELPGDALAESPTAAQVEPEAAGHEEPHAAEPAESTVAEHAGPVAVKSLADGQAEAQAHVESLEPVNDKPPTDGHAEALPAHTDSPEPAPDAPEDAAEAEPPRTTFADLGLSEPVLRAIADMGYLHPTPIQQQAIPYVLMGRDVLGTAQTGTGKTAGFTLPMLEILAESRARARMPRSLILEPTRELALQVAENFLQYGKHLKLTHALIIGGESMSDQKDVLARGVDVLIATPGRLIDMFERGTILLTDAKVLVIDEADRMLDMGFIPDVERIVAMLPRNRQTLLFSATMGPEIRRLADAFLQNPKEVTVSRSASVATTIIESLVLVAEDDKREALRHLVRTEHVQNALIFCNRKRDVDILNKSLTKHHFSVGALHGDMAQSVRFATLEKFKAGELKLLVCSDVAARGLDIGGLSHVFNFDVPHHPEDYVHRIGRTGRAGLEGHSFTIAVPDDRFAVEAIEKLIGHGIPKLPIEGLETVGWSESDGRRRRGRKPTVKKADVKLPKEKEKAAAKPARTAKPKAEPAVAVARAKPGADELPLAPPPRERARRDEGHARRDEVHARRDEGHHHEPRRDDRSRDPRGRHDDLGPAVLGFGDDIPAFMLVRGRTRHAHVSIDDGEAQA
jgi:superfamily II DNA/RNA helicase